MDLLKKQTRICFEAFLAGPKQLFGPLIGHIFERFLCTLAWIWLNGRLNLLWKTIISPIVNGLLSWCWYCNWCRQSIYTVSKIMPKSFLTLHMLSNLMLLSFCITLSFDWSFSLLLNFIYHRFWWMSAIYPLSFSSRTNNWNCQQLSGDIRINLLPTNTRSTRQRKSQPWRIPLYLFSWTFLLQKPWHICKE